MNNNCRLICDTVYGVYNYYTRFNERCRRKGERSKQVQKTRQSNTTHPRQSLFLRKKELPRVGLEPHVHAEQLSLNDSVMHVCAAMQWVKLSARQ